MIFMEVKIHCSLFATFYQSPTPSWTAPWLWVAALTLFKFRPPFFFFFIFTLHVNSPGCSYCYHSCKYSSPVLFLPFLTAVIEMEMVSILMEISFCYMFYSLNCKLLSPRWNVFHLPNEHHYLKETGCSCYNFIIIHICT